MERFGFVGLPNAGKSSLYNALAGGGALAAPYAFATVDPNVGVAKVPDDRLDRLAEMSASRNVVPAAVQFVDIAGLVKGAAQGEGLGNRFLSHIRDVDAVVFVLRAFVDDDVPGSSDPVEQLDTLEVELVYADLESVEKQVEKRRKAAKGDSSLGPEVAALDVAVEALRRGTPLYRADLPDEQRDLLRPYFLLTNKSAMAVVNIDESQLDDPESTTAGVREALGPGAEVVPVCVQLEAEAVLLDPDERTEMLEALGLGDGALAFFLRTAYHRLGLRTFFTTGEKESRAWTFRAGSRAPQAAGVIHTDFERGFIRAEVIRWDELLDLGSWSKARDVGRLRVEGKEYEVQDGDVVEFRFNVEPANWLVKDGHVLASAEIADGAQARARGLLGRDGVDGVMVFEKVRSVHTFGMRFPIDVAFCDRDGVVLRVVTLRRGRVSRVVWRAARTLEAEAGAFAAWGVSVGDRLELR